MAKIGMPKVGDTVRIMSEGKVTWAGDPFFEITGGESFSVNSGSAVKSIEVLTTPLKIGDVIDGMDARLAALGDYAAVVLMGGLYNRQEAAIRTKYDGKWWTPGDFNEKPLNKGSGTLFSGFQYKVVYLPPVVD